MISYICAGIVGVALLIADQCTKAYVAAHFTLAESQPLLGKILDLTYINNGGGAWGMMSGYTWLLLSVTAVIMLICIALLIKVGLKNKLMFWAITLVLAGGIGNMLDRIFRGGEVVDFLHFTFWPSFPVFNVADCGICVGAGLLILYFLLDIIADSKRKKAPAVEDFHERF